MLKFTTSPEVMLYWKVLIDFFLYSYLFYVGTLLLKSMLGIVVSSLPSFLLRLLIINEESLLAFCCLFHGDVTKLPTVLFIFSVVLYKLENPEVQVRLPDSFHQGSFKYLTRFAELAAHWVITNVVITCWHLFYSILCSYFTSVVSKEVEEPSLWPMGIYWSRTITKTERVENTFFPTVIGTLLTGYLIAIIFLNGSQGSMIRRRMNDHRRRTRS